MKKLALFAASVLALPVMIAAAVFADSPGQLASGDNYYLVRNVTKNTDYGYKTSAACSETVKYNIEASNTQYGALQNVTAKANLSTGALSLSAVNGDNKTVTSNGSVAVSVPAGSSLKYVSGSSKLYKIDGTLIRNLADGITGAGVNTGALAGSTREFIQFQAKVECATTPQPKTIKVCELDSKKVVTINENDFNAKMHSKDLSDCDEVIVTELPRTGAGSTVLAVLGLGALVASTVYYVQSRRNLLG